MSDRPLRILFAAPVWAPSRAFGGPVVAAGELVRRLVAHGHTVDVLTTTIVDLRPAPVGAVAPSASSTGRRSATCRRRCATAGWASRRRSRSRSRGRTGRTSCTSSASATPSRRASPRGAASRASRTSSSRSACSSRGSARCLLKRALDATLYRGVARGAAAVVVASEREADDRRRVRCGSARRCTCAATAFPSRTRASSNGDLRARLASPTPRR